VESAGLAGDGLAEVGEAAGPDFVEDAARDCAVVEISALAADDLVGLVALARDQHRLARRGAVQGFADRGFAIVVALDRAARRLGDARDSEPGAGPCSSHTSGKINNAL
jgi:hypothetical protein